MDVDGEAAGRLAGRGLLIFIATMVCHAFAAAQSELDANGPEVDAVDRILSTRGSITLRNVALQDALFTISETWKVNLLFGQDIDGQVSGVYRDATLSEVLGSLLLANGYGYRPRGQSLIVMPLQELGDTNAMLKTASIALSGNRSEDVVEAARMFLSPQGQLHSVDSLNSLMVRDYPENIKKVTDFVARVIAQQGQHQPARNPSERPAVPTILEMLPPAVSLPDASLSIAYFYPRHTTASSLREAFETLLGPTAKVVVVETENRIAIIDRPEGLRRAHQIFAELDMPREQVRITALIYDVTVEELEKLGVNWTHNAKASLNGANSPRHSFGGKFGPLTDPTQGAFNVGNAVTTATGVAGTAASASTASMGAASITTLNKYLDLNTVISALQNTEGARLLADPSVTVLDREEATIRIVTEVPIQQLTQTSQGGSIGTTSFREAGVTLKVTPQIGGDDTVTLEVSPTFSVLSGFNNGQPIIDTREASTVVRIANGQTIVIGGLRQRSEVETVTGIPTLMHWKRLGKLFRSHSTTVRESELIVFLRPELVTVDHIGTEREVSGLCAAHQLLDRLNWPSEDPVIPSCNDPNCPYHFPRPRFAAPQKYQEYAAPAADIPADMPGCVLPNGQAFNDHQTSLMELQPAPFSVNLNQSSPVRPSAPNGRPQDAGDLERGKPDEQLTRLLKQTSHTTSDAATPTRSALYEVPEEAAKNQSAWPRWLPPTKLKPTPRK